MHFLSSVAVLALSPGSASAEPSTAAPPVLEQAVALGYGYLQNQSAGLDSSGDTLSVSYRLWWARALEGGVGLRWVTGPLLPGAGRPEGFVSVSLAPDFGIWRPRLGLEAGYSWANVPHISPELIASGDDFRQVDPVDPFYIGFVVAPLRASVWRLEATVLGLGVASMLPSAGRGVRFHLELLQLSMRL